MWLGMGDDICTFGAVGMMEILIGNKLVANRTFKVISSESH
jgi:hypothetical protein